VKPWPVVIASLWISPAYAFDNQVIGSTFASPIVTNDVSIGVSPSPATAKTAPLTPAPLSNSSTAKTGAALAFPMQSPNPELVAAVQNPNAGLPPSFLQFGPIIGLSGNSGFQLVITPFASQPSGIQTQLVFSNSNNDPHTSGPVGLGGMNVPGAGINVADVFLAGNAQGCVAAAARHGQWLA
jgi:hypothetical protein